MLDLTKFDSKRLDLLFDVHEKLCESMLNELYEEENKETDEYTEKLVKASYLLNQLQNIIDEINKRKDESLIYSVEDIYKFAGQYDKYTIFRFYKTSDAHKKFGNDAFGFIYYRKGERENLEKTISQEKYERTNGKIFLIGSSEDDDKNKLLESEGFMAQDILEVLTSDFFSEEKQYKKEGQKEIPRTIEIKFDPTGFDLEQAQIWLSQNKIKDGYTLLHHDYMELYANLTVLNPDLISEEENSAYLLNREKTGYCEEAEAKILLIKYRRGIAKPEELDKLNDLLKKRRIARLEIIKRELGISDRQLEKFKEEYPDRFDELLTAVVTFETETLTDYKTSFPVYWDFERFIHIYLRHYENYFIDSSTAKGTKFQYKHKDIRRLICQIIERLKENIEEELSNGRWFAKYADKGFYFNGNFYSIRINNLGCLMQFHPID